MAMERGDYRRAVELLHRVVDQQPDYLPEVLDDLHHCHQALDDLAGHRAYLEDMLGEKLDVDVVLALTDLILETEGRHQAAAFITDCMERQPSLRGLLRLIDLNATLPDVRAGQILIGLRDHMERLLAERPAYQCSRCGYAASTLHWQCPSCRSWSTLRRITETEDPSR